jgi:hypothetical protein
MNRSFHDFQDALAACRQPAVIRHDTGSATKHIKVHFPWASWWTFELKGAVCTQPHDCVWFAAIQHKFSWRLVAGLPGSILRKVMWDLWLTKWYWDRFHVYISVSLLILILLTAPIINIIIRSWHNRPTNGRRTKWTHSHSTRRI